MVKPNLAPLSKIKNTNNILSEYGAGFRKYNFSECRDVADPIDALEKCIKPKEDCSSVVLRLPHGI